jgi:hypothetical protein
MNTIKSKNRSKPQTLEEDLRVWLSPIRPRTRDIMRHCLAQVSHWYLYAYIKTLNFYACLY